MNKILKIKNWGPLLVLPDEKIKNLWGELRPESIEKIKKHLESLRKDGVTREEFMGVLESASRPK